jgi:hypothetical protein
MDVQTVTSVILSPTPEPTFYAQTGGEVIAQMSISLRDAVLLLLFAMVGVVIIVWTIVYLARSFTPKNIPKRKKSRR